MKNIWRTEVVLNNTKIYTTLYQEKKKTLPSFFLSHNKIKNIIYAEHFSKLP